MSVTRKPPSGNAWNSSVMDDRGGSAADTNFGLFGVALLSPHDQTLFRVQAVDAFGVHLPALAAEQHRQAPIAVAHVGGGQFFQLPPQRQLRVLAAAIALARPHHPHQPCCPTLTDAVGQLHPLRQLASQPRLQSFFETISCRICRSSDKSATRRFSRPFSSRNWCSSRSSVTPRPA